jgi:hypothetical protein
MNGRRTHRHPAGLALAAFLIIALAPGSGGAFAPRPAGPTARAQEPPTASAGPAKEIIVRGDAAWTDTGIDVGQNDELLITAAGGISLQRGNPTAFCGPDGYNMKTAQQPLPGKNIGALVGRVVQLVSVARDPVTNKEVRDELVEVFFVGSKARVLMPIAGRVFLGPNENVVGDNAGSFRASIIHIPASEQAGARPEAGPVR